jgi:glycosyltransferase involved in cell wall biosynthesis
LRVLISTPCAYGLATVGYVQSLVPTIVRLGQDGYDIHLKMQGTESLINRARNTDATYALKNGFDKILFIDADMVFTYENVIRLLTSKREIVGGTYPLKTFPLTLNFNPLPEHGDLFGTDRQQDNYLAWVEKYADDNGEAEVMHLPTGFLLVDTKVLAKLTYSVPWYQSFNPDVKTTDVFYDFFPTTVVENQLRSEDWGFCEVARAAGFPLYLQTRAVNAHVGTFTYGLGQHIVSGQAPLLP